MRLLIAGGGTGGHLFPAIAIAEEWKRRNEDGQVLFVGTRAGLEARLLPREGWQLSYVLSAGIKGKGPFGAIWGITRAFWGVVQSLQIIRSFRPGIILGMGGYASAPAIIAGTISGVKTAIHEQNAMPGLTNRLLGRIVKKVFISHPASASFFKTGRTFFTGNPVRRNFLEAAGNEAKKDKNDVFTLFIFGGSRGAHSINKIMTETLTARLKDMDIKVIHQTGEKDFESVKELYMAAGINAEVHPFIDNMLNAYMRSDLIVSRAGATTIAELVSIGKPSVLIPYPYAADDHQRLNAASLVDKEAAEMILEKDLDAEIMADTIKRLAENREMLGLMGQKAASMSKRDSAGIICEAMENMTEKRSLHV